MNVAAFILARAQAQARAIATPGTWVYTPATTSHVTVHKPHTVLTRPEANHENNRTFGNYLAQAIASNNSHAINVITLIIEMMIAAESSQTILVMFYRTKARFSSVTTTPEEHAVNACNNMNDRIAFDNHMMMCLQAMASPTFTKNVVNCNRPNIGPDVDENETRAKFHKVLQHLGHPGAFDLP